MNKPLDPNVVLCEGGILPQVLPNPKTVQEYLDIILNPIPAKKFYLSPADIEHLTKTGVITPFSTVSAGSITLNPVAQSLLADEVKNATLDSMSKGSITIR